MIIFLKSIFNIIKLLIFFIIFLIFFPFYEERAVYVFLKSSGPVFIKLGQFLSVRPDLVGEKLVYTQNSNMDDHTHQSIISDIQSTLADLTTRIENLEG